MEPSLKGNDMVIINKLAYIWNNPAIGDIIALKVPKNASSESEILSCKRVVAVGGETVHVKDKRVYVNGKERRFEISKNADENFNHKKNDPSGKEVWGPYLVFGVSEPYRVPEGCYFVLGDNIQHSVDSRCYGAFAKQAIVGKVVKIYWPPRRIGELY